MKARSDLTHRLGRKVAQLRREQRLAQKEVADRVGIREKVISQLERGISVPRIERLEKIAEVLHATLPDLFDFVEEESDRRSRAMAGISYILRGRRAADVESVLEILRLVFEIKRRERPEPTPRKSPRRRPRP